MVMEILIVTCFNPGTLTSITNFASSLSRNMDLLSLDHNYREQQDWLRQRPLGVAEGVRSGLTGFGLSLLGKLSGFLSHLTKSPLFVVLTLSDLYFVHANNLLKNKYEYE